jgi:hypothetical protein
LIFLFNFNVSSTKAEDGKNRLAILAIFRDLHRAKHAANGYSNVSFAQDINPKRGVAALRAATHLLGFDLSYLSPALL